MTENTDSQRDTYMKVKDFFLSNEDFELRRNPTFGFLETYPQPLENLNEYYQSEEYISHTDSEKGLFAKVYQLIKVFNIRYKFSLLNLPKKSQRILDYGCGTGDFLKFAQNQKHVVLGVEPNEQARLLAQFKLGEEKVTNEKLDELESQFDVITLWHVLEHIPDLENFVSHLNSKIKDDGKIFIAVPNYLSFDAKFYKKFWAAYDVPRHLWHFDPKSIQTLFESFGMKIEKTYPLWFDSFYICLLSEKYKNSKFGFIRAAIIAILSNVIGTISGNTSSIVYQITKKSK